MKFPDFLSKKTKNYIYIYIYRNDILTLPVEQISKLLRTNPSHRIFQTNLIDTYPIKLP